MPAFPERALITAKALKVKKGILKVKQDQQNKIGRKARSDAINAICLQPELGDGDPDDIGLLAHFDLPHLSHRILELPRNDRIIFCKYCSAWSSRLKLRKLLQPCEGLKAGNRSQLRILQSGLMPGPGVRLPPNLKRYRKQR